MRLALIADSPAVAPASDLLLTALSGNSNFQLMERDEVQKLYREQGLSAVNGNEVKLGRILGADGVLLLKLVNNFRSTNLSVRLVAVKPGVVLTDSSFAWPVSDGLEWANGLTAHLNAFVPKLALLDKDAIPISLVNLRCAIASPGASELERALTTLALRRLSCEPRLFVLERRKLQLLSDEKALNTDESTFWNGSYLLEGVIDQQGVSEGRITLDARLIPPKGGAAISFQMSAGRTNLAEVVNQLALKLTSLLQVKSTVPEWKPLEEALSFYEESKWALRWRSFPEAQSAADAAWALGKTDFDCALARLEAYRCELAASVASQQKGSYFLGPGHDNAGRAVNPPPGENAVQAALARLKTEHPIGFAYALARDPAEGSTEISSTFMQTAPEPVNLESAARLLELYQNLSGILSSEWSQPGSREPESRWRHAGVEILTTASEVLRNFYFAPPSQPHAGDGLADLRALARMVARQICRSKAAQDTYFVGNRLVTHDELAHTMPGSIFECMLKWGVWWQERPENGVALYRELMTSPVFSFIHGNFWLRDLENPRLIGWTDADRLQISSVWEQFVQELATSSNALWQLEAKALAVADAPNPAKATMASSNLFAAMLERRAALVTNNVEVLYLNWGVLDLVSAKTGGSLTEQTRESLAELTAMQEDWRKHMANLERQAVFEKQKVYLKENHPYEVVEFSRLFGARRFNKNEALELQPLVSAYKSNLLVQSQSPSTSGTKQARFRGAIAQVTFLERDVGRILNPEKTEVSSTSARQLSTERLPSTSAASLPLANAPKPAPPATPLETITNVTAVNNFLAVPLESVGKDISAAVITAHHWQEERLVLNLSCRRNEVSFDEQGRFKGNRLMVRNAIAVLDPATGHWTVLPSQEKTDIDSITQRNRFYHHTTLCRGQVFTCEFGQVRRYDAAAKAWQDVVACEPGNYELFSVNGRLFAADSSSILEIVDEGKSTRALASSRRRPVASTLDTEELGEPMVFEGPNHSLRACTKNKIAAFLDGDWRLVCPTPPRTWPAVLSHDGLLFVTDGWNQHWCVSRLATGADSIELCFGSLHRPPIGAAPPPTSEPKPKWKLPPRVNLADLSASSRQPDLYLLVDHSKAEGVFDKTLGFMTSKRAVPQDGYHAALLCFSTNGASPLRLGLRFESEGADPPVTGEHALAGMPADLLPRAWMLFAGEDLFLGREQSPDHLGSGNPAPNPPKVGVWRIPVTQLDGELAAQRQAQTGSNQ